MNNLFNFLSLLVITALLTSCSTEISSSRLAEIENRTEALEELFQRYEDMNDDL